MTGQEDKHLLLEVNKLTFQNVHVFFHAPSPSSLENYTVVKRQVIKQSQSRCEHQTHTHTHTHTQMLEHTLCITLPAGMCFSPTANPGPFQSRRSTLFRARVAGDMILFGSEINNIHETS